jgi:hypothetical protein
VSAGTTTWLAESGSTPPRTEKKNIELPKRKKQQY